MNPSNPLRLAWLDHRALPVAVVLVTLALNLFPLWWGLPAVDAWAFDEIRPNTVLNGWQQRFSDGWATNYPPFHYYLLGALFAGPQMARQAGWVDVSNLEFATMLYVLGRALSVLLATAAAVLWYRTARLIAPRGTATLAVALVAWTPPLVYYAKTMNLEAPYLFWFSLAAFLYCKAWQKGRMRDLLGFVAAAVAATCTKDQAFALFVLPALVFPFRLHRLRQLDGAPKSIAATVGDRRILGSVALAVVLFALFQNLLFNWDGFQQHLRWITQRSPSRFDLYPVSGAGYAQFFLQGTRHLLFILGWPASVLACVGILRALRRFRQHTLPLATAIFGLSYVAFFLVPIRHNYVRFLLPLAMVGALFAALEATRWLRRLPSPVAAVAAAALLGWALLRSFLVDLALHDDRRYEAERWIEEHPTQLVVGVGRQNMLPRGVHHVPWGRYFRRGVPAEATRVVFSLDDLWGDRERRALVKFENDPTFETVYRSPTDAPLRFLKSAGLFTNLDKISPAVVVFDRTIPPEPLSLVLIIVDTLRADHLGLYGYERPTSPNLDRWADRAAVFDRAYATSPWTLASVASLYTGRYPERHHAGYKFGRQNFSKLNGEVPTLAEMLAARGYETAAVVSNVYLTPRFGTHRGFERFFDLAGDAESPPATANVVVDRAVEWIDQASEPFFLSVHAIDPHLPYDAPPPDRGRFSAGLNSDLRLPFAELRRVRNKSLALDDEDRRFITAAYDEEVAFTDRHLGRLLDTLEQRGLMDRAIVMLTSDHGEELFDHGGFEHGHSVYDEVLRIPWLVWGKHVVPRRIATPASLVDFLPTLLDAVGTVATEGVDGRSFWSEIKQSGAREAKPIAAQWSLHGPQREALVDWPWKLTRRRGGSARLFHLEQDPRETVDLAQENSHQLGRLEKDLDRLLSGEPPPKSDDELDEETLEQLRALGYVD